VKILTEKEAKGERKEEEEETFGRFYLIPYILLLVSIILFIFMPIILVKLQPSTWVPILLVALVIFLVSLSMLRE